MSSAFIELAYDLLDLRVHRRPHRPARVVAQKDDELAKSLGVELAAARCGIELEPEYVEAVLPRQHADQDQSALLDGEARTGPDVAEEMVGGVAEEVAGTVPHLPAVDLLHL